MIKRLRMHLASVVRITLICLVTWAAPAFADNDAEQDFIFDIKAQPLAEALVTFALQSNSSIVFGSARLEGLRSRPLFGEFSLAKGLDMLLKNHGLGYSLEKNRGGLTIRLLSVAELQRAEQQETELSKVVVRGYVPGDWVYKKPNSDDVVTHKQLEKLPPLHAADMLREASGVFVAEDRTNPGLSVNIRGMQDFGRVNMTLDGARQNYQQSGHGVNGQAYIDPALIRQIDIQKGPSSGENGAGVTGGVVNFSTINASDLVDNGDHIGGRANISSGIAKYRNGYKPSGSLAGAYRDSQKDLMLALSKKDLGDYDAGKNGSYTGDSEADKEIHNLATKYTMQDLGSVLFKAGWNISDEQRLQLGFNQFISKNERKNEKNQKNTTDLDSGNIIIEYTNIDFSARLSRTLTKKDQIFYARTLDQKFDLHYETETYGFSVSNKNQFELKATSIALSYGAEYYHDKTDPSAQQSNISSGKDYTSSFKGPTPQGDRGIASIFNEVSLEYMDWLEFKLGLRYDHYRLKGKTHFLLGRRLPHDPATETWRPEIVDKDQGKLLPTVSAGYTFTEGAQLFAAYGEGWRPPAISETLMFGKHLGDFGAPFMPNPTLKPEHTRSYELGLNLYYHDLLLDGDTAKTKAVIYNIKTHNYISNGSIYVPSFGGITVPGDSLTYQGAIGFITLDKPLTLSGFELKSEYDTGIAYARLNYTYTDLDYEALYDIMPNGGSETTREFFREKMITDMGQQSIILLTPPAHKGTLDLGVRLSGGDWVSGIRGRYFSENKLAGGPEDELRFIASKVYDIYSSYQFNKNFMARLTLENIGNRLYATPLTLSSAHVAPGRTLLLTLSAKF